MAGNYSKKMKQSGGTKPTGKPSNKQGKKIESTYSKAKKQGGSGFAGSN